MTTHHANVWPYEFAPVADGRPFILRPEGAQSFSEGDMLVLEEWDDNGRTGRTTERRVTHTATRLDIAGLPHGHCLLGLAPITKP